MNIQRLFDKIVRGLNLNLYYSKKTGVWLRQKSLNRGKYSIMRKYELFNMEREYLVQMLDSLVFMFPFGEIVGENIDGKQFLTIRVEISERSKEEEFDGMMKLLFRKKEIFSAALVRA